MINKLLLGAGCVLLLVMCVLLVVFLRGGDAEVEEEEHGEPAPVAATPAPAPAPALPVQPQKRQLMVLPPALAARPAPAAPTVVAPVLSAEPVVRGTPSSPLQVEITKMQKLVTSRLGTTQLRDRTRRLADALAEAKRTGRWPKERIRRAEMELKELQGSLNRQVQKGAKLQQAAKNKADRELERARFVGDIPEKGETDQPPR